MPYSAFSLKRVKEDLGMHIVEHEQLFPEPVPIAPSDWLTLTLEKCVPLALAINTEKSRSEWIIAPILLELKELCRDHVSIFSGKNLDVDAERGLDGYCDYIISTTPEQYYIAAPILTIVEAKKENIVGGLGQCIAAMYAAHLFNAQEQTPIPWVYGAVTTGTHWKFLKLQATTVYIDRDDYYVNQVDKLLGILVQIVPVMHGGNTRAMLQEAARELRKDEKLGDLTTLLAFFASFTMDTQIIQELLRWDMVVLEQTPWYQEIIHKGEQKGRMEGRLEERQRMLQHILHLRFGLLPSYVPEHLATLTLEQMEALVEVALNAPSIEAFLEHVPSKA